MALLASNLHSDIKPLRGEKRWLNIFILAFYVLVNTLDLENMSTPQGSVTCMFYLQFFRQAQHLHWQVKLNQIQEIIKRGKKIPNKSSILKKLVKSPRPFNKPSRVCFSNMVKGEALVSREHQRSLHEPVPANMAHVLKWDHLRRSIVIRMKRNIPSQWEVSRDFSDVS